MNEATYDALVRPRRVALVGASDTVGKATARPLEYLKRSWRGVAYPVNPMRETVAGQRSWASIADLPDVPDHVYVMTSAGAAVTAVQQSVARGVPVVTLMSDEFVDSESGGRQRRQLLRDIVDGSATRLLGPSSLGVATLDEGLLLTANAAFADAGLRPGGVFVAAQSGSAIGALASRGTEAGIGFRALVSTGNELDLTLGEICRAAVDDPQVTSFALFLENLTGATDLRTFALAAAERDKPVLAYKLGRSDAGAQLAVSHTGALAGDDAVADALLADLGIARVGVFEALVEGQHLGRTLGPADKRPRVGVVSTTGGGGAMVVDCLAVRGAELPGPSLRTMSLLEAIGVSSHPGALIDLTLAGTRYDVMKAALEIVLAAPEFDVVVAVAGSSARFHPDLAVKPIVECATSGSPLTAFIVPAAPDALRLLQENGVSAFRTPEACADAVVALFGRGQPRIRRQIPPAGRSQLLDEASAYDVMRGVGVTPAEHAVVVVDDLPAMLPVMGPVAVKLLSADVAHKSDIGGVILGVADGDGLREAVERIQRDVRQYAPGISVDRVLVQTMAAGLGEALVGFRHDDHAGPVVVLAAGGVLAELYQDRSVRIAPVDLDAARTMVEEVTAFRALGGYRNGPRGDLEALARTVVAVSQLADTDVVEAEINPLLVLPDGDGVVAVDALVRRASAGE